MGNKKLKAIRSEILSLKKELGLEKMTDFKIKYSFSKVERKNPPLPPFQFLMNMLLDLLEKDKCVGCDHNLTSCLHCEFYDK